MEEATDDDLLIELQNKLYTLSNERERARINMPDPGDGLHDDNLLISLASKKARARLDMARSAYFFWQQRLTTLQSDDVDASPAEVNQAEEQLAIASGEVDSRRKACIDE